MSISNFYWLKIDVFHHFWAKAEINSKKISKPTRRIIPNLMAFMEK
jgi:hypothetical protein